MNEVSIEELKAAFEMVNPKFHPMHYTVLEFSPNWKTLFNYYNSTSDKQTASMKCIPDYNTVYQYVKNMINEKQSSKSTSQKSIQ